MGQHLVTHDPYVTHPIFVTYLTHRPIPCSDRRCDGTRQPWKM